MEAALAFEAGVDGWALLTERDVLRRDVLRAVVKAGDRLAARRQRDLALRLNAAMSGQDPK